jgi:hypothetical protein
MARSRHPDKEIEDAVASAEADGWRVVPVKGHAWAKLYCARADRDGCKVSVWSTPRNAGDHARDITRAVKRCPHQEKKEENDEEA